MDTILLARHGETVWNKEGIITGNLDSPLTESGKIKIVQLAESIARYSIEKIWCSPLGRAVETSNLYASIIKPPPEIIIMRQLAELSAGHYQGKKRKEILPPGRDIRVSWSDRPPGGESYADAEERVLELIDFLSEYNRRKVILIVGHAGINRVFLKRYQNMITEQAMAERIEHNKIYILKPNSIEHIALS